MVWVIWVEQGSSLPGSVLERQGDGRPAHLGQGQDLGAQRAVDEVPLEQGGVERADLLRREVRLHVVADQVREDPVGQPVVGLVQELAQGLVGGRVDGELQKNGGPVAVRDDGLQEVPDDVHGRFEVLGVLRPVVAGGAVLAELLFHDLEEQLVLGVPVAVEAALGVPGAVGDLGHRGAGEPLGPEQLDGGGHQLLHGLLGFFLLFGRHPRPLLPGMLAGFL